MEMRGAGSTWGCSKLLERPHGAQVVTEDKRDDDIALEKA
jgi:hypothetical protein